MTPSIKACLQLRFRSVRRPHGFAPRLITKIKHSNREIRVGDAVPCLSVSRWTKQSFFAVPFVVGAFRFALPVLSIQLG